MSGLINKLKSNVGLTIDLVIAVIAILILAWAFMFGAPSVRDDIKSVERDIRDLSNLRQASIVVPSVDPNKEDEQLRNLTINPQINQQMRQLASSIDGELVKIRDFAEERNKSDHDWLVNGLFPKPVSADRPHVAKGRYIQALQKLLGKPSETNRVGLDAGMPPSPDVIKDAVERVRMTTTDDKRGRTFPGATEAQLSLVEQQEVLTAMQQEHIDLLIRGAKAVKIYADTDPTSTGYPFTNVIPDQPDIDLLWEAQTQLWIITDICRAIMMTNATTESSSGVLTSPVKRLIKLSVEPGHIGLHVPGYVRIGTNRENTGNSNRRTDQGTRLFEKPVKILGEEVDEEGNVKINTEIRTPDNFFVTPTGRISNLLYDVRHARLQAVVDFQELPKLLEAINSTNFMTVLSIELTDVDEYQAMAQGYLYGPGDMVEVDMVIESLWLRTWTLEHMPDPVKISLGLIRVEGQATDTEAFEEVWSGGDSWENYGQ